MTLCRCHISKQCTVGLSECRMYTRTDELQKWLNCDPSTPHQLLSVQYWQTYHFTIMSNISLLLIIDSVAVARLDKGCQQGGFGGGGAAVAMVMRWSTVEFRSSSDPQVSSVEWKCQDILNALFFGRLLQWSQHTHTYTHVIAMWIWIQCTHCVCTTRIIFKVPNCASWTWKNG